MKTTILILIFGSCLFFLFFREDSDWNLSFLSYREGSEENVLGFNKALKPILFQPSIDSAKNHLTGEIWSNSKDCESCHKSIYKNWLGSRHKVAHSNPHYQVSHEKEPSAWCLNCHSPLIESGRNPEDFRGRFQSEDGVSCTTCHVRQGYILTPEQPNNQEGVHQYREVPSMKESEFCGNCHQFNFPTHSSRLKPNEFSYSNQPMQNTLQEWKESPYYPNKNCQRCHLFPGTKKSHTFSGGHDLEYLNRSFEVEIKRLSSDNYMIRILGNGIGHHFPTGDHFRSLRIKIYNENNKLLDTIQFRKHYVKNKNIQSPQDPSRQINEDTSLKKFKSGSRNLIKEIDWYYKPKTEFFRYELYIYYQSDMNQFLDRLPENESYRLFQKGIIHLSPVSESKG